MSKFDGMTNAIDNWQGGLRDGFPLAIAYFTLSFAFGIFASNHNIGSFESFLISLTNVTSAGQFVGVTLIAKKISFIEMALTQLILNSRYLIMSCSVSQKYDSDLPLIHRCLVSLAITDEIFGMVSCQKGKVSPFYTYGIMCMTTSSWCLGTICGCISGSLLSPTLTSALHFVLYCLYFAIIIPPSKTDKAVRYVCIASIIIAVIFSYLPYIKTIQPGIRILIITLIVSSIAAVLKPVEKDIAATTAEEHIEAHKEAMKVELYDE